MQMYRIVSHPMGDYITGRTSTNEQCLIGLRYPYVVLVLFDSKGAFRELRMRELTSPARSLGENGPYLIDSPEFRDALREQLWRWQEEIGSRESPIVVEPFCLEGMDIGIESLPTHFREFAQQPNEFSGEDRANYPELIDRWSSTNRFVLSWGTDYYLTESGEIT